MGVELKELADNIKYATIVENAIDKCDINKLKKLDLNYYLNVNFSSITPLFYVIDSIRILNDVGIRFIDDGYANINKKGDIISFPVFDIVVDSSTASTINTRNYRNNTPLIELIYIDIDIDIKKYLIKKLFSTNKCNMNLLTVDDIIILDEVINVYN